MDVLKIARLLPALGIACMVSLPAAAQTSPGTMSPVTAPVVKAKTNKHAVLPSSERFQTAAAALAHCPGGLVVWATLAHSKVYHSDKSKYYGRTKHGAYACKADLDAAGFHQAKN